MVLSIRKPTIHISRFWLRMMGLAGILGGLILFSGDMMFYYNSASTNLKMNMGHVSDIRVMSSGISALLATWFYLFGLGQVYYAFRSSTEIVQNLVLICFAAIVTSYGVIHGAYVAIAATAKLAVQNHLDLETATALATQTNQNLRVLIYPVFAILSYIFIREVWKGKTAYPRWIILFFPLIPFLFQGIISKILSGSLWIIISGGFLNLILVIFFTASTIALWNSTDEKENEQ